MKPLCKFDRNIVAVTQAPDVAEPVASRSLTVSGKRQHQGAPSKAATYRGAPVVHRDRPKSLERELWAAVILQAVNDATGNHRGTATPAEAGRLQEEAVAWFRSNSRDFRDVCMLADLDPDAVRERALKLIDNAPPRKQRRSRWERNRAPTPAPRPMSRLMLSALATTALTPIARAA